MFPSHKLIGIHAAMSLLQGRALAAILEERTTQPTQTNAMTEEQMRPVVESRQVRRARERREAKNRRYGED